MLQIDWLLQGALSKLGVSRIQPALDLPRGSAGNSRSRADEKETAHIEIVGLGSGRRNAGPIVAGPATTAGRPKTPGPGAQSKGPDKEITDLGDLPLLLGDVVICPTVAKRQAPVHAGSLDDELALLLVHGMLHVLGDDHDTPEAEAKMHARERRLLEELHWGHEAPAAFRHKPEGDV